MTSTREKPPVPSGGTAFDLGADVRCEDGTCGTLGRIVVDPIARIVTHLVVEPHHRHALARLVPVSLVEASDDGLRLHCSRELFDALQHAEETEFLPREDPWLTPDRSDMGAGYPVAAMGFPGTSALMWPYFTPEPTMVRHERVPLGEVEVRRGDHVHATDGMVGRVRGLVVDPDDHHVSHVLVHEGHLWHAEDVAIPIGAVGALEPDGVHVTLTKDALAALPAIGTSAPA